MVNYFESGYAWQTYSRFERRFRYALEYVPLDKEFDNVWSPRFRELLTQICAEIDSFFRNMARSKSLEDSRGRRIVRKAIDHLNITDYREYFEPIFELSSVEVLVCDAYGVIKPFAKFARDESPPWWVSYNNVKHNWAEHYAEANLRNTLYSLGALFLLNVLHKESQVYLAKTNHLITGWRNINIIQQKPPNIILDGLRGLFKGSPKSSDDHWVETRLFLHEFRKE